MSATFAFMRLVSGGAFGAGMASIAAAATKASAPAFGPEIVVVFGFDVPVLSALFGLVGVILARRVAPASVAGAKLGRAGNWALTALLVMGVLALIISGQKQPLVALGWSIGLGFTGLGAIELLARTVMGGAKLFLEAFVRASITAGAAWTNRKGTDGDI